MATTWPRSLTSLPRFALPRALFPASADSRYIFSSSDVYTPGDAVDVLVAMNPAALKMNLPDLRTNGILIVNLDNFKENDLRKAQIAVSPLEDQSLDGYRLFSVELTKLTRAALKELGLDAKSMDRCKNFFALGMCYGSTTAQWTPPSATSRTNSKASRSSSPPIASPCRPATATAKPPKRFRSVMKFHLPNFRRVLIATSVATPPSRWVSSLRPTKPASRFSSGPYPITPASDILHELSQYKDFGVITFQAEDEIAAITSAIGAAYTGALGITTTSGPGMALKTKALGLAVAVELPLVICDIQRGGPSTGLPTKTEQADLLQALFGRNSEAPIPVVAPSSPGDCFWIALEASRIAIKYMVPVIVLSDGYLANGAEPWKIPDVSELPEIPVHFETNTEDFHPYRRNPTTLARPWAIPGTPGLEHRVGGIEKQDVTGNINYDPLNHERMVRLRAAKVEAVATIFPTLCPQAISQAIF